MAASVLDITIVSQMHPSKGCQPNCQVYQVPFYVPFKHLDANNYMAILMGNDTCDLFVSECNLEAKDEWVLVGISLTFIM